MSSQKAHASMGHGMLKSIKMYPSARNPFALFDTMLERGQSFQHGIEEGNAKTALKGKSGRESRRCTRAALGFSHSASSGMKRWHSWCFKGLASAVVTFFRSLQQVTRRFSCDSLLGCRLWLAAQSSMRLVVISFNRAV